MFEKDWQAHTLSKERSLAPVASSRLALLWVGATVAVTACSGVDSATILPDDAGTPTPDGFAVSVSGDGSSDAFRPGDSTAPPDAVPTVSEEPYPLCHDLAQRGAAVTPVANLGGVPAATPLTELPHGLYSVTAITEYETAITVESPRRITVAVAPTRYFYRIDGSTQESIVAQWTLANGRLKRTVLCRSSSTSSASVEQRVDAAPDGFIVYASSDAGRPLALRYARLSP